VVVVGLAVGALLSLAASPWVAPLLYGVSPRDPATYAAVVTVLLAVAVTACLVPAWRAARVDPSVALRAD
jgi:ABC-type antimicrobial peptide transport system permease subunit